RSPRAEKVDVGPAVHVGDAAALRPGHEERRAAHSAEGAHGAVHAAGNHPLGFGEESIGACAHGRASPAGFSHSTETQSRWKGSQRKAFASATRPSSTDTTT